MKRGFTVIELLVVISILAIMATVGFAVYSGVTAKVRDGQRIKDLQVVKQALELYRSDEHKYPATGDLNLADITAPLDSDDGSRIYLSQIPIDINPNKRYFYAATPVSCNNTSQATACTGFVLCAKKDGSESTYTNIDCANTSLVPLSSCGGDCDMGISSQ
ncbi:MAG: type II secretion system protein [Candidatus Daviesbacteria bacterium]|nr:type II secretion system protein [Candidatus Daviesbacteria bacterium]